MIDDEGVCESTPECRLSQTGAGGNLCDTDCYFSAPEDLSCVYCSEQGCNLMHQLHTAALGEGGDFPLYCKWSVLSLHRPASSPFDADARPSGVAPKVEHSAKCLQLSPIEGGRSPGSIAADAMIIEEAEKDRTHAPGECKLPDQKHGDYAPNKKYILPGESARLTCEDDYVVSGRNTITCDPNKSGALDTTPSCIHQSMVSPGSLRLARRLNPSTQATQMDIRRK
eukprot:GHVO01033746.1.p1 GENE.GHVO01033746.1~~GHVO01033746.1.p1  ORF type:complete len:226 (+),score=51.77 GHVO01033746.1:250-927(+)